MILVWFGYGMMSDYNYWTLVIFQKAMRYPTSSHFRVPRSCIGHPFSLQNSKEVRSCFPLSCLFASTDGTVITLVKLWGSMNKLMIQSYLSRNPDNLILYEITMNLVRSNKICPVHIQPWTKTGTTGTSNIEPFTVSCHIHDLLR